MNKNKKLKLDIEDLRREKMQRENIKRKLEREVKSNKRELLGVIHESQQATDARDKAERLAAEYEQVISTEMSEFETAFQQRMQDLEAERQQHEHRKLAAVAAADTPVRGPVNEVTAPYHSSCPSVETYCKTQSQSAHLPVSDSATCGRRSSHSPHTPCRGQPLRGLPARR